MTGIFHILDRFKARKNGSKRGNRGSHSIFLCYPRSVPVPLWCLLWFSSGSVQVSFEDRALYLHHVCFRGCVGEQAKMAGSQAAFLPLWYRCSWSCHLPCIVVIFPFLYVYMPKFCFHVSTENFFARYLLNIHMKWCKSTEQLCMLQRCLPDVGITLVNHQCSR